MSALGAYRVLLRLYPRQFRAEYGEDMVQLLADQLRDESAPRVFARTLVDVLISVLNRRLEARMNRPVPLAVPFTFAAISASALLTAMVVGSATVWAVFALAAAAAAGAISWAAIRNVRVVGAGRVSSHWWQFLLAGAAGLAALRVIDILVDEGPDNIWYVWMAAIFLSIGAVATGVVLGVARLAVRRRGAAA
jgi:hypothetical protein